MDSEITGVVLVGHVVVPLMITLLFMPYMIRKLTENCFVMLILHTVNFLMYFFWLLAPAKFGKVGLDGKLTVPNPLTLKCFLPYYFKLSEREATWAMYVPSAIFATGVYSSVVNFTQGNVSV